MKRIIYVRPLASESSAGFCSVWAKAAVTLDGKITQLISSSGCGNVPSNDEQLLKAIGIEMDELLNQLHLLGFSEAETKSAFDIFLVEFANARNGGANALQGSPA